MEFDIDSLYPLYHHRYQVEIPVVCVVTNNHLPRVILVDEIFEETQSVEQNISQDFLRYLLARRRSRFRAVEEYDRIYIDPETDLNHP